MDTHEMIQGLARIDRLLRAGKEKLLGEEDQLVLLEALELAHGKKHWKETFRRRVGVYLAPEGYRNHTFGFVQALYEVTEVRGVETRVRTVTGGCLYETLLKHHAKKHPAIYAWERFSARAVIFKVLRPLLESLLRDLNELDGYEEKV